MWKCPECGEEISRLRYSVQTTGTEWGTLTLPCRHREPNDIEEYCDTDYDDSETQGWETYEYNCDECDATITLSELEWEDDEEEEERKEKEKEMEMEEEKHNIIHSKANVIHEQEGILQKMMICDICKTAYPLTMQTFNQQECPKCGRMISKNNFEELLDKGFYKTNE